jgi:Tfp pilus assembly major pilin PilA
MYGRRRLTRVEMAVYAVIVAGLVAVFATYVLDYMEMAEKAAMQTTVTNVASAINLRYAMLAMSGRQADSGQWFRRNPFDLAGISPPNYQGVLGTASASSILDIGRPAWVFDPAKAELVYLPRLYSHLDDGEVDQLRFRLEPNASGFGFVLAPAAPYRWGLEAFAKLSQIAFKSVRTSLFS